MVSVVTSKAADITLQLDKNKNNSTSEVSKLQLEIVEQILRWDQTRSQNKGGKNGKNEIHVHMYTTE